MNVIRQSHAVSSLAPRFVPSFVPRFVPSFVWRFGSRLGTLRMTGGVVLFVAVHIGCASAPAPTAKDALRPAHEPESPRHVQMEPIVVRESPDPLTGLDGYDAQQLLDVGDEQFAKDDFPRALKVYDLLIETFPDSSLVPSAIYGKGLSFQRLAEFRLAYEQFAQVVAEHPDAALHTQAMFQMAFNLSKLDRWSEVADTFWAIRQRDDLSPLDELEARVGQGVAMFMDDDHATAEREFLSALRFHREESKLQYLPAEYWVGQARFYLGEINAREFERLKLTPPTSTTDQEEWAKSMGLELEEKCQLLLRSQNHFIRTIRAGHTGWATAAGYRIGSLYERLHDDLMELPLPTGLSESEQEVYRAELRDRVSVLVMKAIEVYESSLQMARRVGEQNEWVDKTNQQLERMKTLYLETLEHDPPTDPVSGASTG